MAPAVDTGNAVTAKWVGPAGFQLFDGTVLNPGSIITDVGYDEAEGNPYWEILPKLAKTDEVAASAESNRQDWSFGAEEGGEGTGRPELETQTASSEAPAATTTATQDSGDNS